MSDRFVPALIAIISLALIGGLIYGGFIREPIVKQEPCPEPWAETITAPVLLSSKSGVTIHGYLKLEAWDFVTLVAEKDISVWRLHLDDEVFETNGGGPQGSGAAAGADEARAEGSTD